MTDIFEEDKFVKFFVVSDVHSGYTEMKKALDDAGFDPNNHDHLFVSCGDNFDRLDESQRVLNYLMSLPRKILVRGNHEDLMQNLFVTRDPHSHDYHNGTVKTIDDLAPNILSTYRRIGQVEKLLTPLFDQMVDYFETEHYIFVHSWLPTTFDFEKRRNVIMNDWRNADKEEWEDARWGNPFVLARETGNPTGKTIVFGHWHTSWMWNIKTGCGEFAKSSIFDPVIDTDDNYIGIDACVAYSGKVNCIVLEDNLREGSL